MSNVAGMWGIHAVVSGHVSNQWLSFMSTVITGTFDPPIQSVTSNRVH